ncbi:hypothetical protein [Pantoea sp. C2G6]|uniref:hypothetical protein n=1 Tax=Pantoea sp. C2G6 TaxID=3243084 RepID=UPI003ED8A2A8
MKTSEYQPAFCRPPQISSDVSVSLVRASLPGMTISFYSTVSYRKMPGVKDPLLAAATSATFTSFFTPLRSGNTHNDNATIPGATRVKSGAIAVLNRKESHVCCY